MYKSLAAVGNCASRNAVNLATVVQKLAKGELSYALDRFGVVRRAYSAIMRAGEAIAAGSGPDAGGDTVFPQLSVERAFADLSRDAVALGFDLPPDLVLELERYAKDIACRCSGDHSVNFHWSEVDRGRLANGHPVAVGFVRDPQACPAIARLSRDAVLVDFVARYLRYRSRRIKSRLYWSFVAEISDAERRRKNQTIDYHFDVFGFNFIYASFYLADVDRRSGVDAVVKGSHRHKPLHLLFGSANRPDDAVLGEFGRGRELLIECPKGTSFVEDASCFYMTLAPPDRDRLMLQIRFS